MLPPHDLATERAVLGAILRDPDVFGEVAAVLSTESFYFDHHQRIFSALAELVAQKKPIDVVLLFEVLKQRKHLDDIGGHGYLVELWEAVPTGANAVYHAKLVHDTAKSRRLIHTANEILRDAYNPTQSIDELLAQAGRKLEAIGKVRVKTALPIEYFADVEASLDAADFVEGLLVERAMSVIYGESGSGKTFFALDLAMHVAGGLPWRGREVDQRGVLYLALEGGHGIRNRIAAFKRARARTARSCRSPSCQLRSTSRLPPVTPRGLSTARRPPARTCAYRSG